MVSGNHDRGNTTDRGAGELKFTVAKMVKIHYNSSMKFEKETKMKAQFSSLSLKEQAAMLKELRAVHIQTRDNLKAASAAAKALKAQAKADKQAAAIAKAQARLEKLLAKQAGLVGAKAAKANRRPGKVTTYGAEDNAIASAIMAKKASA